MGTGAFAVPTFEKLLKDPGHEVIALVTMPLRGHPSRKAPICPMQEVAEKNDVLVFAPPDVNAVEFADFLYLAAAEVLFVCDFGRILAPRVLKTARMGGLNLHGSLLPAYRGAAPVHWAIINGETHTGVSIIHMTAEVDAGPVVAKSEPLSIGPDETVLELEQRLAECGSGLVLDTLRVMENLTPSTHMPAFPQNIEKISRAPKLKKSDGLVDWTLDAASIRNRYRAMHPWPGSFSFWHSPNHPPLRLGLGPFTPVAVSEIPEPLRAAAPGTVLQADGHRLVVAAGTATAGTVALSIEFVHPAGKKRMDAASFMRGHPIMPGDRLGAEQLSSADFSSPKSESGVSGLVSGKPVAVAGRE